MTGRWQKQLLNYLEGKGTSGACIRELTIFLNGLNNNERLTKNQMDAVRKSIKRLEKRGLVRTEILTRSRRIHKPYYESQATRVMMVYFVYKKGHIFP